MGEVPRWLEDTDMRDGICALIKTERCVEEQHRLGLEVDNMCRWFGYELAAIHVALRQSESKFSHHCNSLNCQISDGNYHFILRQRLDSISELQERWPTALSSPSRYANQTEVAARVAETIMGHSQPSLWWLVPVVINNHINDADDEETWGLTDSRGTDPAESPLDPEQITLSDVLDVAHSDDQDEFKPELEPETLSKITINWELPEVGWITTISSCLTWLLQVININGGFDMAKDAHVPATMTTVIRPSMDGFPRQTYLPSDTDILASPQAHLNNACINGCATLLYSAFLPAAASCAVLSTHDLPHI